jgi:molybdenum cofactor guanylyltransferase
MNPLSGIILAGGASRRMGEDKGTLVWNGRRAVDRLSDCLKEVGAAPILVAGANYGLPFVEDPEPQAGPVAGLLRAIEALSAAGARMALVLAVDAPTLRSDDLAPLIAADAPGAIYAGLPLPMALFLGAAPKHLEGDASLRQFVQAAALAELRCPAAARLRMRGANTPEERNVLLAMDRGAVD